MLPASTPRVSFHTLGCKLNVSETAALAGQAAAGPGGPMGTVGPWTVVPFGEAADLVVLNTCSVTERADGKGRQAIRQALRVAAPDGGAPYVVVTGCYAQLEPDEVAAIDGVDLVLGAAEKFSLFDHLTPGFVKTGRARVLVGPVADAVEFHGGATSLGLERTRAFLKVQDGCDFPCAYCTIPKARGRSRSPLIATVVAQAQQLTAQGFREIVLTGVNTGDFGRDRGETLLDLLRALETTPGLARLRLSSVEPNLVTQAMLEHFRGSAVLSPHLHLPLQSGDDGVLRRMRRRYTTAGYRRVVEQAVAARPDITIGADVLVGHPGETAESFGRTMQFLSDLPLGYLHVFPYSERRGTVAVEMPDAVPLPVRHARTEQVRLLSSRLSQAHGDRFIGRTRSVLVETEARRGSDGMLYIYGHTDNHLRVALPCGNLDRAAEWVNRLLPVRLTCRQPDGTLSGQPVGSPDDPPVPRFDLHPVVRL